LSTPADDWIRPWSRPTRFSGLVFRLKAALLQAGRAGRNWRAGLLRLKQGNAAAFPILLGESRSPLWSDAREAEASYQRGKVQNLRRSTRALDRILLPAGEVFSFWRQIGRARRGRGYVTGRMLLQGCMVPAVGGGLCQLSNALYDAALQSGCEIIERHAHSRVIPGSSAQAGRDATVAWNYIDLRFSSRRPLLIDARLERDELVVRFRGPPGAGERATRPAGTDPQTVWPGPTARSCSTCADTACHRHEGGQTIQSRGRTAYLVDEGWPEFQAYVRRAHRREDLLALPLDGQRWRMARYRWDTSGFATICTAPLETFARALTARRLQAQGPARLMAQFAAAESLARRFSGMLSADVSKVCVAQSLLPYLWRDGHLGGRGFRVLMTRLPMGRIQSRLDAAWVTHPERASLHDFRAPGWLIDAEAEALEAAEVIITPHEDIARFFPNKALRLDWQMPDLPALARQGRAPRCIVFPGPTIARKGAYEIRAAARDLDIEVVALGRALEGVDFWRGIRVRADLGGKGPRQWLRDVAAVVQPALIEDQPRRLLAALAAGVPVIATAACGIPAREGLVLVPAGDGAKLAAALRQILEA
jgi:VanW like protein/Glycosyl transferases group 1